MDVEIKLIKIKLKLGKENKRKEKKSIFETNDQKLCKQVEVVDVNSLDSIIKFQIWKSKT